MITALRYEFRRITSVRSTYILIAAAVLGAILLGWVYLETLKFAASPPEGMTPGDAGVDEVTLSMADSVMSVVSPAIGNPISIVVLGTLAAQAFGQEYRHGTIRSTLTVIPFRSRLFVSKLVVVLAAILLATIAMTVAAWFFVSATAPAGLIGEMTFSSELEIWIRTIGNLLGFMSIVFAITVLTRVLALGIIIPLVWSLVVEGIIVGLFGGEESGIKAFLIDILPFQAGANFVSGTDIVQSGLIYFGWAVGLLVIALVVFKKRDA